MTRQKLIPVHLSQDELTRCASLARARSRKQVNHKFSNHSNELTNMIGIVGEMAYSKYFNVPFGDDMRNGGDGGCDLVIDGKRIEVKSVNMHATDTPGLLIRCDYAKADYYFLAWVNLQDYTTVYLAGWASDNQLKDIVNLGYGDRYYVPFIKLNGFKIRHSGSQPQEATE